jgi:SAM-dependent methyltransferase
VTMPPPGSPATDGELCNSDRPSGDEHYSHVSRAFDSAAADYDLLYQGNQIMAWMRVESLAVLQSSFAPGSLLLEVGCGTGEEALSLARLGHRIVATDISPAMIGAARAKAIASGVQGLSWRVIAAGQLLELAHEHEPGSFDGAYSSFGGLNCEPGLAPAAKALARLLRPGAVFAASVMNRVCLWEIAWGLAHLRPREAFRRLGKDWIQAGLAAPEGRLAVPTRYYSPGAFARAFWPHFKLQSIRGLPAILPPPNLEHVLLRHPTLLARLEALEYRFRDRIPFRSLGDHCLVTLVRTRGGEVPC